MQKSTEQEYILVYSRKGLNLNVHNYAISPGFVLMARQHSSGLALSNIMEINDVGLRSSMTRSKGFAELLSFLPFSFKMILYVPYTIRQEFSLLNMLSLFQIKSPHTDVTLCLLCMLYLICFHYT